MELFIGRCIVIAVSVLQVRLSRLTKVVNVIVAAV